MSGNKIIELKAQINILGYLIDYLCNGELPEAGRQAVKKLQNELIQQVNDIKQLKNTTLQTLTGTAIVNVYFDWKRYLNKPEKGYPHILWSLNGASFTRDVRVSTVKNSKILTCTVFVVAFYDFQTTDDIVTYDTLEGQFEVYINKINAMSGLKVLNITNLKGTYLSEGSTSAAKELAIMYENVQIEMLC